MEGRQTTECQTHFAGGAQPEGVRGRQRTGGLLLTALWASLVLLTLPGASSAQSILIDDAHTSTAPKAVDSNFGTNPNLNVSASGNVYLKFKLSSALPADTPGSAVERATLKLYIANVTTAGKLDVYAVAAAWDEGTITGNSAPQLGQLLTTTAQLGPERRHEFLVIDLTPLVRQWLGDDGHGANGIPNHGLALVAHTADATTPEVASLTFDSKENSQTSHEAQLNVQLTLGAGGLERVEHDASLAGDGTTASPLGVANGGISSTHLATDAVTGDKIADGSVTSPKIKAPLSLASADASFTLSAANTGAGAAITATGAINTTTQYNIGGRRILSVSGNQFSPNSNVFAGVGAGAANTTGGENSFFGANAGSSNTTGLDNSFFGFSAGKLSTTAQFNSFFGNSSGASNTTGSRNVFAGWGAGFQNNTGGQNTFVGVLAGRSNTTGGNNTHFGNHAGSGYQAGSGNTFIGFESGTPATEFRDGNNNTALGYRAWVDDGLSFATAVGAGAVAGASNTVVLGRSADTVQIPGALNVGGAFAASVFDAATQYNIGGQRVLSIAGGSGSLYAGAGAAGASPVGERNSFFGHRAGAENITNSNSFFGSFSGTQNTLGFDNSFFGANAGFSNLTGTGNVFVGASAGGNNASGPGNTFVGAHTGFNVTNNTGEFNTLVGFRSNITGQLSNATAVGAHARVTQNNSLVLGSISGVNGAASGTNVGIGTTAPRAKLHVANGKVYVEANGQGVILKSPGGACFELTVTDAGALTTAAVACP